MKLAKYTYTTMLLALMLWASSNSLLHAQANNELPNMVLQQVMQKLGRDMEAVTAAIAVENWALVAELAPQIGSVVNLLGYKYWQRRC